LAEWTAAYINDLPDSAFACPDERKYPHHDASGKLDLPHLRNALSRVAQDDTTTCGVGHLREHAAAEDVGGTKSAEQLARAVKFVGPDTIEGLAMPYGVDTDGEQFTKSTDLCLDWFGETGRPVLYNHGLDQAHKAQKVGQQSEYELREEGVWAQSQLNANARYRKAIDQLIEKGALGYSAGAYPHLARKNAKGEITRFPWVELSLTPFPAHPGALGVHYVKSSADFLDEWAETREDDSLPDGL
jgi:hypothetical protein